MASDPIRDRIERTLLGHRLQHQVVEDCDGLPLLDALSAGDDVLEGREEIELLADAIAGDLPTLAPLLGELGVLRGALIGADEELTRIGWLPGALEVLERWAGSELDEDPDATWEAHRELTAMYRDARSALSGDSGRLAGELIEGVAALFGPQKPGDTKLGEGGALDRLKDRWDALQASWKGAP